MTLKTDLYTFIISGKITFDKLFITKKARSVYKLTAKKKFGQNFLIDLKAQQKVLTVIKSFLENYPQYIILEIGPGQGDLTEYYLEFQKPLVALEIDREAVILLKEKFANYKNLELIEVDASKVLNQTINIETLSKNKFVLLASLPYNVGSRLLVDLAVSFPETPFVVILQKEVIQKVVKKDTFTFFGAWLNLFWDLKNPFDLSPHVFSPQPKVYSGVMLGKPKTTGTLSSYLLLEINRQQLKTILKNLFANPSKTLANNLKNLGWSTTKVTNFLSVNNLPINTRLGWDNYEQILELILKS